MKIEEIRKTIIICGGLGASLYLMIAGRKDMAEEVCSATALIWFFFL